MKTNDIRYAKKDKLSEDEFDSKKAKVRITIFVYLDIIERLKKEAGLAGKKYQTLLNDKLRMALFEEEDIHSTLLNLDNRLRAVERKIKAG